MSKEFYRLREVLHAVHGELDQRFDNRLIRRLLAIVRERNRRRIKNQIEPSGLSFYPRKSKRRAPMFPKIGRHLIIKTTPNGGSITFRNGHIAYVASVHHFGLKDKIRQKVSRKLDIYRELEITYPSRELLGITPEDIAVLEAVIHDDLYKKITSF